MAIELTRKRLTELAHGGRSLHVPPSVLVGVAAAIIAICFTSALIGVRDAHRAETAAQARFADAQALLSLPAVDTAALQQQVNEAKSGLAAAQKVAAAAPLDPASDEAAALLVRRCEAVGLSVKGISRNAPATTKLDNTSYAVQGIRITVEGDPSRITALLDALHEEEPSLIPVLASMTLAESGVAQADIGFNVYEAIATPTAVPRAAPTAKAAR